MAKTRNLTPKGHILPQGNFLSLMSKISKINNIMVNKFHVNATHGRSRTPEYTTWVRMKYRCYNTSSYSYKNYGAKGVIVCDRWLESFENFFEDMGEKPTKKHSLDRVKGNLGYFKENCRWATPKVQYSNTTRTRWISHNNITMCLSDWAKYFNVHKTTLTALLKKYTFIEIYERYNSIVGDRRRNRTKTKGLNFKKRA